MMLMNYKFYKTVPPSPKIPGFPCGFTSFGFGFFFDEGQGYASIINTGLST